MCLTLAPACSSKDPGAAPSSSAPAATSAPASAASSSAPPRAPPQDLDLEPLNKAHKCAPKVKSGPCRVLEAVASCSGWEGIAPSGDGRWIGRAWEAKDGKVKEGFAALRSRSVPQSEVPGGVPAKLGLALVPDDLPARLGVEKAVAAYERHDVPLKGNAGVAWLKDKADFPEDVALQTASKHVVVLSEPQAFVCKGKSQELYVVRPAAGGSAKGDGLFAELWAASW
jgi:hypothetical protein